ncbi:hypothetical protein [Leptothermofonsia sp. ETS-13]|uniref:hypothetical protein n=1 Tax=Leptothermofonsia sp. ETS-13 TaxID=3035696 RepID=UPI003B9E0E95
MTPYPKVFSMIRVALSRSVSTLPGDQCGSCSRFLEEAVTLKQGLGIVLALLAVVLVIA